ncbi:Putative porin [Dyella sp. OK004]|uniref:putative porin n=1 Tax=Dyella sp. OK004 TaxID=1855292 RepID=UPI0008E7CF88|nr:putative porin [Dyella sp. OK004]SFS13486.1 Putative porin [Dyella sp. OK004]
MKSTYVIRSHRQPRRRALCLAVSLLLAGAGSVAMAQDAAPSPNATINLIRLMVKKGLITQGDADGLIAEANAEAVQARKASTAVAAAAVDGAQPGDVRVPYVPQSVRNEIRDQVKQEVIAQARTEHWAQPDALPEWLDRISWSGDLRVRDESRYFSRSNSPYFIDYAALNRNGPFDINKITQGVNPPILNTQQNHTNTLSLQAHIGMSVKLGDTITAGIRIGSGNDNNPVSTTQALGGGLVKKNLWLDRAWVQWKPVAWGALTAGRMANPFFVTDLIYSPELNFDGIAGHAELPLADGLNGFATAGLFPIQYTGNDTPSQGFGYQKNRDSQRWLSAAQLGASWKFDEDMQWTAALAYYYYDSMRGQLSQPCALYTGINFCSTDDTAPTFMQKGNSVFLLRNIVPDPSSPGNYAQPQFVGLAYDYHLLNLTNQFDFKIGETPVRLQADYVRNMSYHARDAFKRYPNGLGQPVNNYENGDSPTTTGPYKSGPVGWLARGILGNPNPMKANDWNVTFGYKYLQPDAVLDGLTDPNFHLGGTNAKGFIISADYGIAQRTWLSARYFNAKQVFGPPLSIDVLQLEINSKF